MLAEWLTSCVKEQPEVREALSDLVGKIRKFEDAANPSACRETKGGFWSPELTLFRPGWPLFTLISVVYGIAGIIFSWFVPNCPADSWADLLGKWTDLSLMITVQVFVLGISVVAIAQSISEAGSFVGEYLNDSCRTPWFCCLTLVAVLCGLVGHFLSTIIEDVPNVVIVGICIASVGAAVDCLAMLAFVICETMRCSVPSEAIKVVSRYAARKLAYGYVNDSYVKLFRDQQKDYFEKWCAGKAIHPPSQYYGHYFKSSLYTSKGDNDVEIELDGHKSGQDIYKDYDLKGLARLNKHLKKNSAELYLSSPFYESEQKILGILSCKNVKQNEQLQLVVSRKARKAIRQQKYKFSEKDEDFWDSQESKLNEAIKRAIDKTDPIQVKAYLDAVNVPLSVLRQVRKKHKVVRDAYGEYVRRGYQLLSLYLKALREIFVMEESDQANKLARKVLISVWEETKNILREMDYHTMELYTWLVQQMYTLIQDAGEKAKNLREIRGQFGGFYDFADGSLEDGESKNTEDANKIRLVLHEGLTKWLLIAVERDVELIEQLCDAGRRIVFGREGIKFDNKEVAAQHFVLAGHWIDLAKAKKVNTTAVERLFCDSYSQGPCVNFNELVRFYLDNFLPLKMLDQYMRIFYSPTQTHINLLTGSSHSSGFGMTGGHEMALAFIFLAAHALKTIHPLPKPIAGMSGRITDGDIDTVSEVFKSAEIKYGCEQLKKWLKSCEKLDEAEENKEIAEAKIDKAKVKEHERKFWEGYSRAVPILSMCLRNGNYEIDNNVKNEWRYLVPKIALFDWKYPISGAEGDEYGLSIGHKMEKNLLNAIIEGGNAESEVKNVAEAVGEAVKWLEKEGCSNDRGIVILAGKHSPEIEMHRDKDFIPSWREEVKSMGFNGFYRGFPISWLREDEEEEGEKDKAKEKKPQCQRVVAVDLRMWRGISVREEVVVTERKFGKLEIREWTQDEIQQAIQSEKLDVKDVDKAKRNCPVDISFYWQFSSDELPRRKTFVVRINKIEKNDEKL